MSVSNYLKVSIRMSGAIIQVYYLNVSKYKN